MFGKLLKEFIIRLGILIQNYNGEIAKRTLPRFANSPENLNISLPRQIINPERIFIGNNVWLGPGCLLIAIMRYPTAPLKHPEMNHPAQNFDPVIRIGNRVSATSNLQIAAMKEIIIEDDVMFASNINITDGLHGYDNPYEPYKYQKISKIAPIHIKKGCWIGQNVVILPGVTIGEYSIIGANSVVTKSIPPRSIAVGAPAKIIKQWNDTQQWISVKDA